MKLNRYLSTVLNFILIFSSTAVSASDIKTNHDLYEDLVSKGQYINEPVFGGQIYFYEAGPSDAKPVVLYTDWEKKD